MVWNSALAAFSIMGACRTLPEFYHVLRNHGLYHSICVPRWVMLDWEEWWTLLLKGCVFTRDVFARTLRMRSEAAISRVCTQPKSSRGNVVPNVKTSTSDIWWRHPTSNILFRLWHSAFCNNENCQGIMTWMSVLCLCTSTTSMKV